MDTSTVIYLAVFFFILGAGIIGLLWVLVALFRSVTRKGKESSNGDPNLAVLVRLFKDLTNQELVVEVEGKTYKSANELSSAQLHRLGIISSVLARWLQTLPPASQLESPAQPVAAQPPVPAAPPEPAEQAQPAMTPNLPAPAETSVLPSPVEPAFVAEASSPSQPDMEPSTNDWLPAEAFTVAAAEKYVPPFTYPPEGEVKPVSTQFPDMVRDVLNPTPPPAPVFKSIAMQINDLLQEKIAETQFENRGITVSDGPDHGVLVTLDGKKFSGVKEVPDEEVRSLIRSAVLDWEKQNKPSSK